MGNPHLLALCGSLRAGSTNRMLLNQAVAEARRLGADVDVVSSDDLRLPLYDGDLEKAEGLPPKAVELRERLAKSKGVIISCPEYNYSLPGGFKNAIDWMSRPPSPPFKDKWAALMGASGSAFGTIRMQPHLRQTLSWLGMHVLPGHVLVSESHTVFNADGSFKNPERLKGVTELMQALLQHTKD